MKHLITTALVVLGTLGAQAKDYWLDLKGNVGPGKGKKIVLISGDEEYRSEESMPMLAKILSHRHGFDCTVLFSWSKDGEYIDPNHKSGIRGWEQMNDADLIIVGTRMRDISEEDAAQMTNYLNAGKPVIGFRTATHGFRGKKTFGETITYNDWGLKILGEKWVNHHGKHKVEGARAVIEKGQEKHPILNSVKDIFGPSDVYGVKHLTEKNTVLLRGAVTTTMAPDSPNVEGKKNDPMMPLAWLHSYTAPNGTTTGTSFCTTMGASVDFLSEDLRRLLVNASYSLTGLEVLDQADVTYVDPFYPSFYGFWKGEHAKEWARRKMQVEDFAKPATEAFPEPPGTPAWPHRPKKGE